MTDADRAYELFSDKRWRLNHLYRIRDKNGVDVPFRMNAAQSDLFDRMHYMNCILKARQLGFTTFLQINMLDECLFTPNTAAGTVAHTLDDATEIFETKIKYAYDNLDPDVKACVPAKQDSARKLSFANGSSIRVSTSLRSGTYQLLHISEFGKLAARNPEKAREIRTGALNTVQAGNMIWVESTAEGSEGDFYDMVKRAQDLEKSGRTLTPLDFAFFFYDWTWDPEYTLAGDVPVPADIRKYFNELKEAGQEYTEEQIAWYVKKSETQHDDMKREYPSTPDEAFEARVQGAYYANQIARVRKEDRLCRVPVAPDKPVQTFWDLGRDDETAIWLHQAHGPENRFIGYLHGNNQDAEYWGQRVLEWLGEHELKAGRVYLPHDGDKKSPEATKSYRQHLVDCGFRNIVVLPVTKSTYNDIQAVRDVFPSCWFDEEECGEGFKALENYQRQWDANRGTFMDAPYHNWASHGADAFRAFAVGYKPMVQSTPKPRGRARV